MADSVRPTILMIVRFQSVLSPEELKRRYTERMPEFRKLPGLVQKYYVHDEASGEWGGVYLWASKESLEAYKASDLRKTIGKAYEVVGTPRIETISILDVLRAEPS